MRLSTNRADKAAATAEGEKVVRGMFEGARKLGVPHAFLDAQAMAERIGSRYYRCGLFTDYDIEGVLWTGREMETHDTLSCHPEENVILDVRVLDEGKFQWEYSLKIADGVYVRHCVHADNLIDACRAAGE